MDMTPHFPIYLDYSSTNPCDDRVVDAMIPWLREHFGNPASRSHAWGWEAEEAVEKARVQVADLIGADPREIVWTSGATESNNLAIKGAAQHRDLLELLSARGEVDRQQNIAVRQIQTLDAPGTGVDELRIVRHRERGPGCPGALLRIINGPGGLACVVGQ